MSIQHRLATPVIQPRMRFFDTDGKPLVGGKVYAFKVGTDEFKPTYRNSELTALNTNPIVLDGAGSALIYLRGANLLKIYDRHGNFIEERIEYQQRERAQFYDDYGRPLKNGYVYTCDYQSTIRKTSYSIDDVINPNPIALDENGTALVNIVGAYRLRQYNSKNVFVGDQDFKRPPIKALTSVVYPLYFDEGVAASTSIISGDQKPLNIGRLDDSTIASASIESASIWSVFNIGYMPSEATTASASIESASIQNVVVKHTKQPENLSSSAQLLNAQIENQELNPTPRNIRYMVNGDVNFTFDADGIGYTYSYYRSLTPMNIASLPAPIATGLTAKTYTDTSPTGSDFYVRFSANKASSEFVSSEIKVSALQDDYLLYMPFDTDIHDHSSYALIATAHGTTPPLIQSGSLYVPSASYLRLTPTSSDFNIGTGDFEFGFEVLMMSSGNANYPCVFGVGTGWSSGAVSMQFNPARQFMCAVMNPAEKDAFAPSAQPFDGVTWVKYVVRRVGGVVTTYKDDVAGTPLSDNMGLNFARNNTITVGAAVWSLGATSSHSRIKNLYLRRL